MHRLIRETTVTTTKEYESDDPSALGPPGDDLDPDDPTPEEIEEAQEIADEVEVEKKHKRSRGSK